jgi:hypothetical protein
MRDKANSLSELAKSYSKDLVSAGLPAEEALELANFLVAGYAAELTQDSGVFGAMARNYAIRREDVKLFDAVVSGVQAASGAQFFLSSDNGKLLGGAVGVCIAVAKLIHGLYGRGAVLDPESALVPSCLSSSKEGLTEAEASQLLPNLDPARARAILRMLSDFPTLSRGTSKLATSGPEGVWRSHV